MKSLLKISGLVTFILTEYFICPFFLHFSQKKGVDEIYFINTIYYRAHFHSLSQVMRISEGRHI